MTSRRRLQIGLIGAGARGADHARVVAAAPGADLAVVVDPDLDRAALLAAPAGAVSAADPDVVFGCDAVVVASPTESHAEVGLELIENGIPLLVETPLATSVAEVEALVEASARRGVPMMCGFVERFNAAVATAAGLLDEPPVHCVAIRHSPPEHPVGLSVVPDLLIHDIDLVLGLRPDIPVVSISGAAPVDPETGIATVADCILQFEDGAVATFSASRASQRQIRTLLLATSTSLVEVDLLRQDVTMYRNVDQSPAGHPPGYRAEMIVEIPLVRHSGEPLALQFEHFLRLLAGDVDPAAERESLVAPHRVAMSLEAPEREPEPILAGAGAIAPGPDGEGLLAGPDRQA